MQIGIRASVSAEQSRRARERLRIALGRYVGRVSKARIHCVALDDGWRCKVDLDLRDRSLEASADAGDFGQALELGIRRAASVVSRAVDLEGPRGH